jgi:hypothetical protein
MEKIQPPIYLLIYLFASLYYDGGGYYIIRIYCLNTDFIYAKLLEHDLKISNRFRVYNGWFTHDM